MAISTAVTTLKYAVSANQQVETSTVVGTISTAGNATVIITSRDLPTSPITLSVAVAMSDTATLVAGKIRTALNANAYITSIFTVGGTTTAVSLTRKVPTENDTTLNISVANGTCAGLTNALTSTNTTAGGTFTKLVDIISYPDMGSAPSKLDTTDLSQSTFKTNIFGLQELPELTFECNYDETAYTTISALGTSNYYFILAFGDNDGKFDWRGQVNIFANGGGVDEVRKMTVSLSALSAIEFSVTN